MSRPKKVTLNPPSPADLKLIAELAGKGVPEKTLCLGFGMCHSTWMKRKKDYPELNAAVERGKAEGHEFVIGKLFKIIKNEKHKSHLSAVIFYLKTQCGWKDKDATVVNNYNKPSKVKTSIATPPKK